MGGSNPTISYIYSQHAGTCAFICYASPKDYSMLVFLFIVQELCESRGGRPGLSVLTSLLVSVDVKQY